MVVIIIKTERGIGNVPSKASASVLDLFRAVARGVLACNTWRVFAMHKKNNSGVWIKGSKRPNGVRRPTTCEAKSCIGRPLCGV